MEIMERSLNSNALRPDKMVFSEGALVPCKEQPFTAAILRRKGREYAARNYLQVTAKKDSAHIADVVNRQINFSYAECSTHTARYQ